MLNNVMKLNRAYLFRWLLCELSGAHVVIRYWKTGIAFAISFTVCVYIRSFILRCHFFVFFWTSGNCKWVCWQAQVCDVLLCIVYTYIPVSKVVTQGVVRGCWPIDSLFLRHTGVSLQWIISFSLSGPCHFDCGWC